MNIKQILVLVIGVITGAVAIQACSPSMATREPVAEVGIPAQVTLVSKEEVAIPIHISGIIRANKESRLSFKTGGIIKTIRVNEGDKVRSGEVLAQLDLKEINQQVLQARVALDKAERDFHRVKNLYQDTVTTLETLQNANSALEVAQANLNIAEYNLRFSTITAPSNGIIMKKFVEENEITGAGTPVFFFASDEDSWKMRVGVSDKNVVKLSLDNKAEIVTDAYPDQKIVSGISKIANAPEPTTGLYEVELALENSGLALKPGFFARGELIPSQVVSCYQIPVDAIQEGFGSTVSFYIYDNERAIKQESEALFLHNDHVFVTMDNMDESIQVITQNQKELKSSDKIQLAVN